MIKTADHIQTKDMSIHIVNYIIGDVMLCTEIYRLLPDIDNHTFGTSIKFKPSTGEHYEKYVQRDKDNLRIVSKKDIIKHFSARKAYRDNRKKLTGIWRDFDLFFHSLGVRDIGIYGSVMLGFDVHTDVDFVIYGSKNRDVLYKNISTLHKKYFTEPIYNETVVSRLNVAKKYYNSNNSFEKIFPRQWSTIEVGNNVHSTLHFVKNRIQKVDPLKDGLSDKRLTGFVKKAKNFDFWPKTAILTTKNGDYTIFSTFWPYQSALKEHEKIIVNGKVDEDTKVIYITERDNHYIII